MMSTRTIVMAAVLLGTIAPALPPSDASAASIVLTPDDDRRGLFVEGLDTEFHLQINGGQDTVTFNPGPMPGMGFEERFALEFALGALPAGATIVSSTLTLHLPVLPGGGMQTAEVHGYAGDGTIQGADLSTTNFLTVFHPDALSIVIPIDAAFLQGLLSAGEGFGGFAIRNVTVPGGVFTVWTVDGPAATEPTLAIEYLENSAVPEPATLLMVGTALAAGGLRMGRRQRRAAFGPKC
jgi:hypothetical protein